MSAYNVKILNKTKQKVTSFSHISFSHIRTSATLNTQKRTTRLNSQNLWVTIYVGWN